MKNLLDFQKQLSDKYNYKKLEDTLSKEVHSLYLENLPPWLSTTGDKECLLFSLDDTLIATGYNRIVIGDYGAFVEFDISQLVKDNIQPKKGQEYRYKEERYKNSVKYYWYTAIDNSNIKIYYQKKVVVYADYKPGMFYVSPYEIKGGGIYDYNL